VWGFPGTGKTTVVGQVLVEKQQQQQLQQPELDVLHINAMLLTSPTQVYSMVS